MSVALYRRGTASEPVRGDFADKAPYELEGNGFVAPRDGIRSGLKMDLDFAAGQSLIAGPGRV